MKHFIIFTALFMYGFFALATHNRAGEITYKHISGYTYEITIVTYTYTLSQADRPQLDIDWGDGTSSLIDRIEKFKLPNEYYYRNTYKAEHTYPGPGTYVIVMEDQNRNQGVSNIPNSVMVPFAISTILQINAGIGNNNTPVLLYPPIDKAKVGEIFIHNPSAYDPDGDSLSYKLAICLGEGGLPIPGYTLPYATNYIEVVETTGDLIWNAPAQTGIVNVAMLIEEWRKGVKIGIIQRDIQIEVLDANNKPPVLTVPDDLCVEAGTHVEFTVTAYDPDNQRVTLTATGGPFEVDDSPAYYDTTSGYGTVSNLFQWNTNCTHVRKQPYHIVFKAKDNDSEISLVDLENMYITVIAPKPENLALSPTNNSIALTWDPSPCSEATGYDIYRKISPSGWTPDSCETGIPGYTGFTKIAHTDGYSNISYNDNNGGIGLSQGFEYCYRVVAVFDDGAESYASDEVCTDLVKGIPVITNVSVQTTDVTNGSIYVAWSKPTEFDTIAAPGPYKYLIYHSEDLWGDNFQLIDSTGDINDTIYIDSSLNTVANPYSYRIEFYNDQPGNRFLIGYPQTASSIFINTVPSDNRILLNLDKNVPWINDSYTIYRKNPGSATFDSIGIAFIPQYTDSGLLNGVEYCYLAKSTGRYLTGNFINPIINYSQEKCDEPVDNIAPCSPTINVDSDCDLYVNRLWWNNPNLTCADDVVSYNIYYTQTLNGLPQLLNTNSPATDTTFLHSPDVTLAGCYYVTAVDSFGNESPLDYRICVDECTYYKLPNVFSPDGTNLNDLFKPGPYRFVEKVDMKIYNRWGKLVFETNDPDINWDGKDMDSHKLLTDGVYYYICDVYEWRLSGLEPRTLTGFIELRTVKTAQE